MNDSAHHYQGEAGRRYHQEKRGIPSAAYPWIARLRAAKFAPRALHRRRVRVRRRRRLESRRADCARRLGHDVTEFLEPELARHGIEFVPATQQLVPARWTSRSAITRSSTCLTRPRCFGKCTGCFGRVERCCWRCPSRKERRYRAYDPTNPIIICFPGTPKRWATWWSKPVSTRSATLGQFGYDRFAAVWAERTSIWAERSGHSARAEVRRWPIG
jgi:hypothetical protein